MKSKMVITLKIVFAAIVIATASILGIKSEKYLVKFLDKKDNANSDNPVQLNNSKEEGSTTNSINCEKSEHCDYKAVGCNDFL